MILLFEQKVFCDGFNLRGDFFLFLGCFVQEDFYFFLGYVVVMLDFFGVQVYYEVFFYKQKIVNFMVSLDII